MSKCAFGRQIVNTTTPEPPCPNEPVGALVVSDGDDKRVFDLCAQHELQLDALGVLH